MTRAQTVAALYSSANVAEYNAVLDAMKAAHGGRYPAWYWMAIVHSGLARRKADQFAGRLVS